MAKCNQLIAPSFKGLNQHTLQPSYDSYLNLNNNYKNADIDKTISMKLKPCSDAFYGIWT